jgi:hypothetical protein
MRSRIANEIIAALLLMRPPISAHAKVTGVTFEPKRPIVGHSVTAIATDDQKHKVVKWIWYGTLADAGTHSPIVLNSTVPGRATLKLMCGGTYKVSLQVTYGGPMPPPTETVSALITVARPDALKIMKGLDFAASYDSRGNAIRSRVRSCVGRRTPRRTCSGCPSDVSAIGVGGMQRQTPIRPGSRNLLAITLFN